MSDEIWDGKRERRSDPNDHDKLTRTLVVMEGMVKAFDKHVDSFREHIKEDNLNFDRINRSIYIWTGVVIGLQFVILLIKR